MEFLSTNTEYKEKIISLFEEDIKLYNSFTHKINI